MSLKIIHTSDWHLGKKLFKIDRLSEQKLFLEWLGDFIISDSIDILLVSGDVFDSPTPSNESVKLYFDFLKKLSIKSKCMTYIIAGNHDSGKFLEAPKEILKDLKVTICGKLALTDPTNLSTEHKTTLRYDDFEINLVLIPYFRSHEILSLNSLPVHDQDGPDPDNHCIHNRFDQLFKNLLPGKSPNQYNILLLHHLLEGYELSGSEQIIHLSGIDGFKKKLFAPYFDYVALGHIHKTMNFSSGPCQICYCGAPLKYRFDETNQKHITLLTLDFKDQTFQPKKEHLLIPSFRDILSLKISPCDYEDVIGQVIKNQAPSKLPPLIEAKLMLDLPNAQLTQTIKDLLLKNNIEDFILYTDFNQSMNAPATPTLSEFNDYELTDLFHLFYKEKFSQTPLVDVNILESFKELLSQTHHHQNNNDNDAQDFS
ncbi:MAG: hypothetical protein A2381_06350 [Bdellovibrionales bacterium RIFOXYB1_FULL_37_110]|nr:MAG: hypothetical protein A2181_08370 [Bdellovibrionales bacterium RIFOXYA1_FULL_38_20]OFZ50162.1 MAG: hypothetical protein A2417_19200 [Bdellovibrionales bacterium RIFOXYC1_FULL_37_79]OFZ57599.1 MAG: hypothetical protein A2381_06350 [Bdellovibrionales bacterium RIFOXYB1_FULL_37_110]OFZ61366.1 MAG: hypothetical protein A2577_00715 [Bdellovibrionales bacterium RIFOXYD1_FULL_36_51]